MRRAIASTMSLLTLLAGCASTSPGAQDTLLDRHGLDGVSAAKVIDRLDRLVLDQRPSGLMASVRTDELLLSDEDGEVALDLPEDRFYLSVAPYVDTTHECFYHSLTACEGELGGEYVQIWVTDDSGRVLVNEDTALFDNGFVGLWLPRDITGSIEVEHDGKKGVTDFGTSEDDPTCLTTLQLT
jgi:hypothetical protein